MSICPCCGANFEGDLKADGGSCGARAVGPSAKPERELRGDGRVPPAGTPTGGRATNRGGAPSH